MAAVKSTDVSPLFAATNTLNAAPVSAAAAPQNLTANNAVPAAIPLPAAIIMDPSVEKIGTTVGTSYTV